MKKLFGTDGIRGKANSYPITPEIAVQVGKAVAHVLRANGRGPQLKAVLGKDTRLSGYMIETALTSGMVSMGMDVLEVGPMPTPAVAHLTKSMCADCGIMITASHNPAEDNGIKIFSSDGFKLDDKMETEIEEFVLASDIMNNNVGPEKLGKAFRIDDAKGRYIEFAKNSIKNRSLKGLKIVLDCANGASYYIAPLILKELGAEVIKTAVEPDGWNINLKCGATYVKNVSDLVKQHKADIGMSLDGDADRVIFCDADGNEVNGDRIIGMCALDYKERGLLHGNNIVVTSMSNMGLHQAMRENGIDVEVTDVGDRNVIERMREKNFNIGGEQSGHVIFMDYVTTGDGIITALHIMKLMINRKKTLKELASFMSEYPQTLKNIKIARKIPIKELKPLSDIIDEANKTLGRNGRTVVRYSGTENKIRVLVEAKEASDVETWVSKISSVIEKELC